MTRGTIGGYRRMYFNDLCHIICNPLKDSMKLIFLSLSLYRPGDQQTKLKSDQLHDKYILNVSSIRHPPTTGNKYYPVCDRRSKCGHKPKIWRKAPWINQRQEGGKVRAATFVRIDSVILLKCQYCLQGWAYTVSLYSSRYSKGVEMFTIKVQGE